MLSHFAETSETLGYSCRAAKKPLQFPTPTCRNLAADGLPGRVPPLPSTGRLFLWGSILSACPTKPSRALFECAMLKNREATAVGATGRMAEMTTWPAPGGLSLFHDDDDRLVGPFARRQTDKRTLRGELVAQGGSGTPESTGQRPKRVSGVRLRSG